MDDTISRAAAIDVIVNTVSDIGLHDNSETARYGATYRQQEIITILESLPSAEPRLNAAQSEIVRCKDCEYWEQNAQHGYDEDNEEYHNYCAKLVPDDDYYAFTREANDFCSRGERKRSRRWVTDCSKNQM